MDDDDFDLDDLSSGEAAAADPDAPPDAPTYRVTVAGKRLTLINWMPFLLDAGPGGRAMFDERAAAGVTVADLCTTGQGLDREVVVDYCAHGGGRAAERVLGRWAEVAGYKRIWFPDRVETFDACPPLRVASVTCPSCGHGYRERDARFWGMVHNCGQFPSYCLLCGGDLPQWTVRRVR